MALSKAPYKGTRDFFPTQMRVRNYIFNKMSVISENFAYEPCDGPILEEIDLYRAKSGDELINEQVYSFTDRGDREVAIRPEMTPTIARMAAQVHREIAKPIRWYAIPNLMRYEKPQKGRLREFWQYNADIFGANEYGDVEILQLAISLLKSYGANESHFEILINDRRLVDFVFHELINLDQATTKKLYKLVDRKNKMDPTKFSEEALALTGNQEKAKIFEKYTSLKSINDITLFLKDSPKGSEEHNCLTPLMKLFESLHNLELSAFIKFDPSIVRGLDYYTGMVFEIYDKHPENRRAIAGGGAYANLLQIFNEPALGGVGIGLGEVPLTDFLTAHKLLPDFSKTNVDLLITYSHSGGEKSALLLAEKLRANDIKTEVYFGVAKLKKVFSYAEKKNFKFIASFGEDEIKDSVVEIKNISTRDAVKIETFDIDKISRLLKGNEYGS